MKQAVNCYTFPQNIKFLNGLTEFVLREYPEENLPRVLILLPNRRSCRALRDTFLEITDGKPILLPRIQPIGEVEGEAFFTEIHDYDSLAKQPIDKTRRHFLLMKLVMTFAQKQVGGGMTQQASELAKQLASLLDEVNREGLNFLGLDKLAPENLASHWQQTLDFLTIISQQWPRLLEEEGCVDIVSHRNQLLLSLAGAWQKTPPDYPVIAAGSTGSQKATADLLKVIAHLPQGKVILPALDVQIEQKEWEAIEATHPQYALKKLLEHMGVKREAISLLVTSADDKKNHYIRTIFAPASITANWANAKLPDNNTLSHITLLEADTLLDEAKFIAVKMREALETKEKTAALITPDRTLARMVSAQLARFGIMVDDSAGKPLSNSAPACFLRLVVEMVASRAAPAPLLALIRHPLAAASMNPATLRYLSREIELLLLRGIRRDNGLEGLYNAAKDHLEISLLLKNIHEKSEEFSELFSPHHNATLKDLLNAHIRFAEWLATSDTESGEQRLWSGDAGNKLAEIIADWNLQADILPPIDSTSYPALFDALLASETYHSKIGLHPRLHILSPMEARLQSYDMVILSSLNEGTWPQNSGADPWMSRPQRHAFGLPEKEREIGQSAHDFVMQLYSPEVLLSRARKVEGKPTIPSRWWVRLQTLLSARAPELFSAMHLDNYFLTAKNILEKPAEIMEIKPPAPNPPLEARPRSLRVTAIDNWLRDPYSLYARYILNLRKLDDIDREPNAADFGNLVHKALELFTREFPQKLPEDTDLNAKMMAAGKIAFADFIDRPAVACLWWPRFISMANWLLSEEKIRRKAIETVHSEVSASWNFVVDGKPFTLSTRIDRLEKLTTGEYALIDYKTGTIPSKSDRENGLSNQLPLEALIIEHGKLPDDIVTGKVTQMEYWKLSGSEDKCEITQIENDLEQTKAMLEELIRNFDDEATPYAAQSNASILRYNDYEHLTRRKEWELV